MPGDETLSKRDDDYESEEDDDDELEQVPHVDVDVTKLNPLSPEVISKQVCISESHVYIRDLTFFFCGI
jgi:translation initiation factor 2 subunit 3